MNYYICPNYNVNQFVYHPTYNGKSDV